MDTTLGASVVLSVALLAFCGVGGGGGGGGGSSSAPTGGGSGTPPSTGGFQIFRGSRPRAAT